MPRYSTLHKRFEKFPLLRSQRVSHYCCRKTAVDFSVPELVRSQSTFSTNPEVFQNSAGFTLCSSAGLAVGECLEMMCLTPCLLCVYRITVCCVYWIIICRIHNCKYRTGWAYVLETCVCGVPLRVWLPPTINFHR